jgi:hypothetical protein
VTVLSEFVDEFVAWAKARGEILSPTVVETLLVAHQAVDDANDVGHWHCDEVASLLLTYYPRHVSSTQEIVAGTVPTIEALFDYLAETGRFAPCSDRIRRLRRSLLEAAEQFGPAMRAAARPESSRALALALDAEGAADRGSVDEWMSELRARPYDDRLALAGPDDPDAPSLRELAGLPRSLPPVRVRPTAELAEAARACTLLAQARELALFLAGPTPVTSTGVLRVADAIAAADALELWEEDERVTDGFRGDQPRTGHRAPRGARAIPALMRRWTLAVDTDLLRRSRTRVQPGAALEAWPDGSDEQVLAVWEDALESVVSTGLDLGEENPRVHVPESLEGMAAAVLTRLFLEREPCPLDDLAEGLEWAAIDSHPFGAFQWSYWKQEHGCPVRMVVDRLVRLGALHVADGEVALSPLGVWAVRRQLADLGVDVPERPPLAACPASELITALVDMPDTDVKAELNGWLDARAPDRAAAELLQAAAESDPASRAVALTAVADLGDAAEAAWRQALSQPCLRAYAAAALPDVHHELTRADADWMLIDVCAALLRFDAVEETVAHLDELGTPAELAAMMDDLGRVAHDDTVDVLTSIGDHHPDPGVSKAARKAAFRSRSRLTQLR